MGQADGRIDLPAKKKKEEKKIQLIRQVYTVRGTRSQRNKR